MAENLWCCIEHPRPITFTLRTDTLYKHRNPLSAECRLNLRRDLKDLQRGIENERKRKTETESIDVKNGKEQSVQSCSNRGERGSQWEREARGGKCPVADWGEVEVWVWLFKLQDTLPGLYPEPLPPSNLLPLHTHTRKHTLKSAVVLLLKREFDPLNCWINT